MIFFLSSLSAFGGDIPDIVVDGRETDDEAVEVVPLVASNPYESGDKGLISPVYQDTIWSWLKVRHFIILLLLNIF